MYMWVFLNDLMKFLHSPAGVGASAAVAAAVELPLSVQHCWEILTLYSSHQSIICTSGGPAGKHEQVIITLLAGCTAELEFLYMSITQE